MLIRAILEIIPYFALAALCLGVLAASILRMDACRRSAQKLAPPPVSAGFLVTLVSILFIAFLLVSLNTVIDNSRMRQLIYSQQGLLAKAAADKAAAEKDAARLKGRVKELAAQKALYTATIETIVKKESASR